MNTALFIAKRISFSRKNSFSRPIIRIAIAGVSLGIAVMIISIAVVTGFQTQIRDKVIGFGSHIQINKYDFNSSYEASPISRNQHFYPSIDTIKGIRHIQVYAYKAGIIKTEDQIQGVVLKGVGTDFDFSFFTKKLIEGKAFELNPSETSTEVLISKNIASKMKLKVGDDLRMYFVSSDQSGVRGRRFNISGIYETGLLEFDELFVIGDISQIQRLNGWEPDQIAGFEILLDNFDDIDRLTEYIYGEIGYDLNAQSIKQVYPHIFDWLQLMDMNVIIILALMILVSGITMISILLIVILERTSMIGILKSFGARNILIRKLFIYNAIHIIGRGMILGNTLGLAICIIQQKFGIMHLDQESYYISVVPVNIDVSSIIIINILTFIICSLILIIPSLIIGKISPLKAIRFS